MPRKTSFTIDLSIVVPILVGIIVLLGVYIIVNSNKKHVTFAVPEVTEEVIIPNYVDAPMIRNDPIFLQQPTYFNPNLGHHDFGHDRGTTNMYNIQMKEGFTIPDFAKGLFSNDSNNISSMPSMSIPSMSIPSPSTQPPMTMPSMNNASQKTTMNLSMPSMPPSVPMNSSVPINFPSPMESSSDSVGII